MRRLLKDKFKFIFTKVAAEGLDNSWLNREITEKDIEELIKLFEFVISPADKEVNGAVYTPEFIRNYIVKMLS